MVTSMRVWIFANKVLWLTNQEVLCSYNLLLVLSGRQDNARLQREKLLRDYPLNATLWWLNWFDGRSESALAQWRGLCQGRDVKRSDDRRATD